MQNGTDSLPGDASAGPAEEMFQCDYAVDLGRSFSDLAYIVMGLFNTHGIM